MKEYRIYRRKSDNGCWDNGDIYFNAENKETAYDLYADYILDNYGARLPEYEDAENYNVTIDGTEYTFVILQKVYYFRTNQIVALDDEGIKKYYDRTYAEYDRKDECTREEWQDCDTDVESGYVNSDDDLQVGNFAILFSKGYFFPVLTVNYFDSRTGADSQIEHIDYDVDDIQEWLENFAEDYWNTCEESETPGYHDEIYIKDENNEIVASIKYNTRL